MRRRTFDRLVSTEGLVLVPVLAAAGGLLTWAQRYISGEVRDQLAAQKIYFPVSDSPELAAPGVRGGAPARWRAARHR
jgi:hypothetical protein